MRRAHGKPNDKRVTLTSDVSAEVARRTEWEETTAVMPAGTMAKLLEEAKRSEARGGAPRFEVVELDPEDDLIVDDDIFEARWEEVCPPLAM